MDAVCVALQEYGGSERIAKRVGTRALGFLGSSEVCDPDSPLFCLGFAMFPKARAGDHRVVAYQRELEVEGSKRRPAVHVHRLTGSEGGTRVILVASRKTCTRQNRRYGACPCTSEWRRNPSAARSAAAGRQW